MFAFFYEFRKKKEKETEPDTKIHAFKMASQKTDSPNGKRGRIQDIRRNPIFSLPWRGPENL
jgi:hypothetical protein